MKRPGSRLSAKNLTTLANPRVATQNDASATRVSPLFHVISSPFQDSFRAPFRVIGEVWRPVVGRRKHKSSGFGYPSYASNHENAMLWRVTADIVVTVHAAYVAIVVVGFAAILLGSAAQWRWVRNFYIRAAHLAMILPVCAEALVGTTCPLTRLENALRLKSGESGYTRDFIGYWLHWLIFYNASPWVFTTVYLTFGILVLLTLWFVPVRRPDY